PLRPVDAGVVQIPNKCKQCCIATTAIRPGAEVNPDPRLDDWAVACPSRPVQKGHSPGIAPRSPERAQGIIARRATALVGGVESIVNQSRHHATSSTIVRVIAERFEISAVSFRVVVNTYDSITVGRTYDRSAIRVPSACFSVSVRRRAGDGFDAAPRTVSVTGAPP